MRLLLRALCIVLLVSGTAAFADNGLNYNGLNYNGGGGVGDIPPAARTELIESWNDDLPLDPGWTYGSTCYGWRFEPTLSYTLERIEFYTGGLAGTTTVEVRADDGSGFATGQVLGAVTYPVTDELSWQGADLVPPVEITAGTLYFIRGQVVVDAIAGVAQGGVWIQHSWSDDCVTWGGPAYTFHWMARFYGTMSPTATTMTTWGRVKSLYR
ncbi:MAG: DUF4082 domain-containing protein [Candidatus Eisenbacteria bacterium]